MDVLRYAAFAARPGGGNPAGVVLDARGASDDAMLTVARDVGYSETAFVVGGRGERDLDLRFFSPRAEVAFCGHATVATSVALAERIGVGPLVLRTPAGVVEVATSMANDSVEATLTSVPTSTRPAGNEAAPALRALRIEADDLDADLPLHVAHAGNDHLVVGLRDRARLDALEYDVPALEAVCADRGWTTVHVVWQQDATTFHARDPFPLGGVVEDPATGAAALAFGGYLRDLALVPPGTRVTIHQGDDMGRPSILLVDVDAGPTVRVTGGATPIP